MGGSTTAAGAPVAAPSGLNPNVPNRLVTTLTGDAGTVAGIATGVAVLTG